MLCEILFFAVGIASLSPFTDDVDNLLDGDVRVNSPNIQRRALSFFWPDDKYPSVPANDPDLTYSLCLFQN